MSTVALDSSVAIPYLQDTHVSHWAVRDHIADRRPLLTGHSVAETYSVLTRLGGDRRVAAADAVALIATNFGRPVLLSHEAAVDLPSTQAEQNITGGAVYDALVALAARDAGVALITRDARAIVTYRALRAPLELVPDRPEQEGADQN